MVLNVKGDKKPKRHKVEDLREVFEGIPVLPNERLVTVEQFRERMGRAPKSDIGKYERDVTYKGMLKALQQVQHMLANGPERESSRESERLQFIEAVTEKLNDIEILGTHYHKRYKKGKKHDAVDRLLQQVEDVRNNLPGWLEPQIAPRELANWSFDEFYLEPEYPDVFQGQTREELKKGKIVLSQLKGVCPKYCEFDKFNDGKRDEPPKHFGAGKVNSVSLIKFEGRDFIFKKESTSLKDVPNPASCVGIDVQKDYRGGNRNIGCGIVSDMLKSKVIPKSRFAISEGEVGLLMDRAPGKTAWPNLDKPWKGELSETALASLHEQLIDLQVVDILTGQPDRHGFNYLVDFDGDKVTVTGIDCDFAFGKNREVRGEKVPPYRTRPGSVNGIGHWPRLVSKQMAEQILNMKPSAIDENLSDLLDRDELDSTRDRLEKLQEHVRKLQEKGCIVENWVKWRSKEGQTVSEFMKNKFDPNEKEEFNIYGRSESFFERDFAKFIF